MTRARSGWTLARWLGLLGIIGGVVLLAAFVVDIPPGINDGRLVIFNVGAIAIVVAVYRRQVSMAPTLALVGAFPQLLPTLGTSS